MAVAAVAEKEPVASSVTVRRFQVPDIDRHGGWMIGRLLKAYDYLNEKTMVGWLRGLVYSSEAMFLFQEHSVGLAQIVRSHTLQPMPVIWERFVFAQDEQYIQEAAEFYPHFATWAKHNGASTIIVEEASDVPHDLIRAKLGRLYESKQVFAKV